MSRESDTLKGYASFLTAAWQLFKFSFFLSLPFFPPFWFDKRRLPSFPFPFQNLPEETLFAGIFFTKWDSVVSLVGPSIMAAGYMFPS